jgi:hypothetical protein
MTQDEIMKMAHKAGLHIATDVNWMPIISLGYAERFAKLVAEHEREACAKVCDDLDKMRGYSYADKCATAIRARGETK